MICKYKNNDIILKLIRYNSPRDGLVLILGFGLQYLKYETYTIT